MLYYIALLSIFTSSIIAIYNWKVQKGALYVAGILGILSAYALTHYYSTPEESDYVYAILYGTLSPLWLLPGPLLYFYFRRIFQAGESTISWKDGLHFIPSIIHLINILPYLFSPFKYKLYVAHAIHQDINNLQLININSLYSFKTAFLIRPIALLVYLFWCTLLFLRQKNSINKRTQIWLHSFILSLLITTLVYLYVAIKLFSHTLDTESFDSIPIYSASGIAYILLPIALILFFPEILYGIKKQEVDGIEEKSEIKQEALDNHTEIAKQIKEYLRREKPFLNPDFELADLATALEVSPKQVSFACKHVLNIKFTVLRAQLRVEHAKELLKNGLSGTITIDAIGFDSGFKSRSTFYDAFKSETGMTPSQYLENTQTKKA
jgi:AraC-like DNA-binding protein